MSKHNEHLAQVQWLRPRQAFLIKYRQKSESELLEDNKTKAA